MGFGGIGGFAGDVLGATTSIVAPPVAQYLGQQEANEMNRQAASNAFAQSQASARESMAFSSDQAKQQMAFQERMSSTVYQRASEDLKKAGLNPLMALTNNASTPSGSSGSGAQATAQMPELGSPAQAAATSTVESAKALSSVLSSVMQAKMFNAQSDNLKASTANLQADATKKGVETNILRPEENKAGMFDRFLNWANKQWTESQKVNSAKDRENWERMKETMIKHRRNYENGPRIRINRGR